MQTSSKKTVCDSLCIEVGKSFLVEIIIQYLFEGAQFIPETTRLVCIVR